MSDSRILIYDIETAFNIGGYWGPKYDVSIAKLIQAGYVFGFAWKFLDEKTINSCYIWDFPKYKTDSRNDIEVIKQWQKVMSTADIVVGHNSDSFDNKVMTARCLVHNLPPISMPQTVDTLKIARRVAKFDSNKLDDLSNVLGFGRKIPTDVELWWGCMQGDEQSQAKMVKYNKQDVKLTEDVYRRLLPYDTRHPNRAAIENRPTVCPKCSADNSLVARGFEYTKTSSFRRWKCNSCLSWVRSRLSEKEGKPDYV